MMKKLNYNDFVKYIEDHRKSMMVIINNEKDREIIGIALPVYCFEGEFTDISLSLEEAYDDFYEFVINEPVEVEFENSSGKHKMLQSNLLTIDEVVARGYDWRL